MRKFFVLFALSGCMVGPDYTPPVFDVPDSWGQKEILDTLDQEKLKTWWEVYQDPILTRYIAKAESCNYSILVAEANILRARAIRQISAAQLFPHLSGDLNGTKTYFSKNGPVFAIGPATNDPTDTSSSTTGLPFSLQIPQIQNLFNALFDATWELDLFGKTRRAMESADALIQSAEEEKRDLLVSLYGEVAKNYIELRKSQRQKVLLEKKISILREISAIIEAQYVAGFSNAFNVEEILAELAKAEALLPDTIAEIYRSIYTLSVLLGELPETLVDELIFQAKLPPVPKTIHVGLRSDLLRRRPDIRKAERELAAATAAIGVAVASFFPTINLLGLGGFQALQLPKLLEWGSKTWAYGADVAMPIYEGGKIMGTLHLTQAIQKAAAYTYQQVVLSALQNAESSLTSFENQLLSSDKQHSVFQHVTNMAEIAQEKFMRGLTNRIDFLTIKREWVESEMQTIEKDTAALFASVSLYKSLGGGS